MAAPSRPLVWSPLAVNDLIEIWDYHANVAGPRTADKIVGDIEKRCGLLEGHRFAGRTRHEIRPDLRSIVASPYVVFYRAKGDVTEIVRVLHERRDLDEIFAADPAT